MSITWVGVPPRLLWAGEPLESYSKEDLVWIITEAEKKKRGWDNPEKLRADIAKMRKLLKDSGCAAA